MSDPAPLSPRPPGIDPEPLPRLAANATLPGCGLAAYAFLLLGFFAMGITGLVMWTWTVVDASSGASPNRLVYGGSVSPYQLEPMRQAGLLGAEELPDVFHAETLNGSTSCAISRGVLLRLGPEGAVRLPLDQIAGVDGNELEVRVTGTTGQPNITCVFASGEGGDRLLRILARD